jgi:hypothetical protein
LKPRKDRLRASFASIDRVPLSKTTKCNELGLRRFQYQIEPRQALAQSMLDTKRIPTILEAQDEVVDVPHEVRLALQMGFDNPLKPQVEQDGRDEP